MKRPVQAVCNSSDHPTANGRVAPDPRAVERCARIFRALGEPARLKLVARLAAGEACVGDLARLDGESMTTVSQRLRVLRTENIVGRRRSGKHVVYFLADRHVSDLIQNGLAHASEPFPHLQPKSTNRRTFMSNEHTTHPNHPHQHGEDCGHTAIEHNGHTDYLHDGHLHHMHEGHVDEHKLDVNAKNPADCTEGHDCGGHDAQHQHGPDCGHEAVPHGDHVDYLVDGHLHHQHEGHCDNHGNVDVK